MTVNRLCLYNDDEEAQMQVLDGRQSIIWTALPAIVTKINLTQMTIEAQPTIMGVVEDENGNQTFVKLPLLVDVLICFPSAGGFTMTFPLAINDEVLIIWASRCIDAWWQSGGIQKPMEARMHDLSDGFAVFGPKSIPNVISGISSTDLQLRKNDGTAVIGMTPDGSIYLTPSSGKVVTVNGSLVATGEVTAGLGTIPLSTHLHPQTGGPNTDAPII